MENQNEFLSIQQVMEILGVSRTTLYRIMNDGELKFYQIRGRRKFKRSDVDRYIEQQKQA